MLHSRNPLFLPHVPLSSRSQSTCSAASPRHQPQKKTGSCLAWEWPHQQRIPCCRPLAIPSN
eukprot:1158973-Pelagomonas_calceolata.AAC.21